MSPAPLFIDIHVLQSVPPSNINRDDTGSPKTATYGGVRRARVSSQAWKRATRRAFQDKLDPSTLGVRTKKVVDLIAEHIASQAEDLGEDAIGLAAGILNAAGIKTAASSAEANPETGYLLFVSRREASDLAAIAIETHRNGDKPSKKAVSQVLTGVQGIDVALFGRMVADAPDLNTDASAQVAHAISVHAVEPEFDYFTAVDDRAPEDNAGAGMIGTVEFNSSTYYRYATLNVPLLEEQLGSAEASARAARAFVEAFITSMPTGKQNTFANRTLPAVAIVQFRSGQPINLVGAFETAVTPGPDGGYLAKACSALKDELDQVDKAYGSPAERTFVLRLGPKTDPLAGIGEEVSLAELGNGVATEVEVRLQS
ncbi:MAG: type I-E CRISPR-associated protein Cas7/Cse4/CasC [Bifidobacteriaceae bacterium]|jgi:CRISPR system Cascade subunit CasC|nr:type I-E CRISPR-associated protein Cas7/Cse4/CasC [Bifidobacteriaceae bacterium]